jgi:hypothetical protein
MTLPPSHTIVYGYNKIIYTYILLFIFLEKPTKLCIDVIYLFIYWGLKQGHDGLNRPRSQSHIMVANLRLKHK